MAARTRPAQQPAPRPQRPGDIAWGSAFLIAFLACVLLLAHARTFLPFISDDALISLRYADRFLHGHGLTWNDGERVEGYSNLLWTLLISALGACGIDLITAARVLGAIGMCAVIGAIVYSYPPRRREAGTFRALAVGALPPIAGIMAIALSGPIAVWAIGGLEQPLLAALLVWALVLLFPLFDGRDVSARSLLAPGLLLGLAAITRPDAPLLTALICLALILARGVSRRTLLLAATLAALPILFALAQLGFRLAYYGAWIPNSAHAKLAPSFERAMIGFGYVLAGLRGQLPVLALSAIAIVGACARGVHRGRTILLASVALGWIAYVVTIGGDIFPGWRHLVVIDAIAALLAAGGVNWLMSIPRVRPAVSWIGVIAMLALLIGLERGDAEVQRARRERWEWDGESIGRMLKAAFEARHPLLAVDPAGCVPYFSTLRSIDMLGLNDRWIAHHLPPGFGRGPLGHELGDGRYVLDRKPDLVLFSTPAGGLPLFRSGREMMNDPDFTSTFQPVMFESAVPRSAQSVIWVRREGGAIGIQRDRDTVTVPGFMLALASQVAENLKQHPGVSPIALGAGALDEDGVMMCPISAGSPRVLMLLPLAPGRWSIAIDRPTDGVQLAARSLGAISEPGIDGQCTITLPQGPDSRVNIEVATRSASGSRIRDLRLERTGD